MIHEKVRNQSQALPCNIIVKFHEEIEGRNEDIGSMEGHFQTAAQRTRASSSYPEEEDMTWPVQLNRPSQLKIWPSLNVSQF